MLPYPVIVLPGIQGTELVDFYPVDPEPVWTLWRSSAPWMQHAPSIEGAVLHPDNLRFERAEPARLLPTELFNLIYGELVAELRKELSPDEDQPVPVYPFAYDWRMPLAATVLQRLRTAR
ncbi:putative lipase [Megalodesulfovibrio gigas DSM 1382 = ATCC 19364]|uniref:Putative lipase n=1 Tax=Megalodesulfovibrio gigas (strain ATCC 19364 / DSM 1382 / NCIMB 9332 / VKM B-1759) TaxID=1121448 RepID=T2GCN2_MEGG1|nr:putative lipase [Megalodesulfovibrio gigas DSM 1382 = ATCC 19364]